MAAEPVKKVTGLLRKEAPKSEWEVIQKTKEKSENERDKEAGEKDRRKPQP